MDNIKNNTPLDGKIFLGLLLTLALLSAFNIYLPQGRFMPPQDLPAPRPVIALINMLMVFLIYGSLGWLGMKLAPRVGFPGFWDPQVSLRQRLVVPGLLGAALGLLFIAVDSWLSSGRALGPLPHPPFPTSLVASLAAGIGEEMIFRLFFISFWVWLIGHVLLKQKAPTLVFWIIGLLSALAFAGGHIPAVMMMAGVTAFKALPPMLLVEVLLLNMVLGLTAAYMLKRFGFVAAVGVHFWTDILWHVVWGGLQ